MSEYETIKLYENRVSYDDLVAAWKKAGKPRDMASVQKIMQSAGMKDNHIKKTITSFGTDSQSNPAQKKDEKKPEVDNSSIRLEPDEKKAADKLGIDLKVQTEIAKIFANIENKEDEDKKVILDALSDVLKARGVNESLSLLSQAILEVFPKDPNAPKTKTPKTDPNVRDNNTIIKWAKSVDVKALKFVLQTMYNDYPELM